MTPLIFLAHMLAQVEPVTDPCVLHFHATFEYVKKVSPDGEPLQLIGITQGAGPMTPDRSVAEAVRDRIMREGFVYPRLIPGDPETSPEYRVAPGALLSVGIAVSCCIMEEPRQCWEVP